LLARSATIFKWTLYTLAGLVWAVVQAAFLQRVTIWGVIPFLYPLIAALPATFEGPAAGTVYALACGVFCDLLLPSSIPCFYTLILPLVGLAAGLLSQSLIPAGYLCSAAAALPAYLLTGIFHCIVLWAQGHPAWGAAMSVTLRELCVSLLWSLPMTWLFRRVYLRVHVDD
jgi:membrane protein